MKNILVCTPYFNSVGGTELEAVYTAVFLFDSNKFKKVTIFTPIGFNKELFNQVIGSRDITFFTYPKILSNPLILYLDRFFLKLKLNYSFSEYLYWKYKSLFFSSLYILSYPRSKYFFSILKGFARRKKSTTKITMYHFEAIKKSDKLFYKMLNSIIVFNKKQSEFWREKNKLDNICVNDIIIPNEKNLLKINVLKFNENKILKFGFLGRIAKEKNIESMIKLIAYLYHKENLITSLYIQGTGEENYIESLNELAKKLNVTDFVTFKNKVISPLNTHFFYEKIDVFLVTSLHEGGPITALEAAAAGRMILGYDVGAMYDRFNSFPLIVNESFEDLCMSAVKFIKLKSEEKNNIVLDINKYYKKKLSNYYKGNELLKILKL
ncbi:glycosyltransferase [Polaribacter septentrionalilitoris]|uniref:glycosyltransferase n=1 Tax=Polaribacter septentrionalilitoris TaxID=2494657 RepID=UPI00135B4355|nr:glycosyltransferase [Polaribacter septentrionalilitoris]